jgi:hypothetical protein
MLKVVCISSKPHLLLQCVSWVWVFMMPHHITHLFMCYGNALLTAHCSCIHCVIAMSLYLPLLLIYSLCWSGSSLCWCLSTSIYPLYKWYIATNAQFQEIFVMRYLGTERRVHQFADSMSAAYGTHFINSCWCMGGRIGWDTHHFAITLRCGYW